MPQLGIDDNRLACASGIPRATSREGIRKATPLMNRKELAVTPSETIIIHQRAPALVGCFVIRSAKQDPLAGATNPVTRPNGDGPQRPAAPRSRPSLGPMVTARSARLRRARDRH